LEQELRQILEKHVPAQSVEYCVGLWKEINFSFTVTRKRSSCFGNHSFRMDRGHLITVNYDLNPQAFLLTYVHEVAHLRTFEAHQRPKFGLLRRKRIDPHGNEWKQSFIQLMKPILNETHFTEQVLTPLRHYMADPKASSVSYHPLAKVLHMQADEGQHLSDVAVGVVFKFKDKLYRKIEVRRTRIICEELNSRNRFLISGAAHVKVLEAGGILPQPSDEPKRTTLNDLLEGSLFSFKGDVFKKIERRRTRVLVEMVSNKTRYLIHGDAVIEPKN
jgi:SprT protein